LICFFDLFFVKFRFLIPAGLVMTDCKHALLEVLPQLMFFQRLLERKTNSWASRVTYWSFKQTIIWIFSDPLGPATATFNCLGLVRFYRIGSGRNW
jgi:hypothetical protein